MSVESTRKPNKSRGDLKRKSETVRAPDGTWWFGIWEDGNLSTSVMVRDEGAFPLDMGDWR